MSLVRKPAVISLFDQNTGHSSVPAALRTAVTLIGAPELSSVRRVTASALTAGSTMAALRSLGTIVCIVVMLVSSMLLSGAAHAERAALNARKAAASPPNPFAAFVTEASTRFAVPEHWIRAVMRVESGENSHARSHKGAMGLMQVMPKTWAELRARYGLGADPYDPHDNILAGAAYIRQLHDRYGAPGFLAAYNAGPGRYERHLATGRALPNETQAYVARLAPVIGSALTNARVTTARTSFAWANSPLFATRSASAAASARSAAGTHLNYSSRTQAVVDLSLLSPQPGNLFVRLTRGIRSQ